MQLHRAGDSRVFRPILLALFVRSREVLSYCYTNKYGEMVGKFSEELTISPQRDGLRRCGLVLYSAMANSYPTIIPGLRSPSEQVKGLVYFGRMLDKIRLFASGKLPEGWHAARGAEMKGSFDARCCRFLGVDYKAMEKETLKGGSDEELLAWAFKHGRQPSEEE